MGSGLAVPIEGSSEPRGLGILGTVTYDGAEATGTSADVHACPQNRPSPRTRLVSPPPAPNATICQTSPSHALSRLYVTPREPGVSTKVHQRLHLCVLGTVTPSNARQRSVTCDNDKKSDMP